MKSIYQFILAAKKGDGIESWAIASNFIDPIASNRSGSDNEVRSVNASVMMQVLQKGDDLNTLSQSLSLQWSTKQ